MVTLMFAHHELSCSSQSVRSNVLNVKGRQRRARNLRSMQDPNITRPAFAEIMRAIREK
jgi:hypothetical protein